ncbi:16S rRNA (guanine(966)-N(2))-methyltransferase SSU rRNA m(2)G966 [Candidatus Karelsulcia muelleri]|nr:16S rRNA (guanine(966)-N(2))-methyltransferase SSU rRNA m(2)G966 [Candidatus Karelsulcia muelleri]
MRKGFKDLRTTTDKAKEGMFNILENLIDIKNKNILELFCGSGNISYEFAYRGAKYILCVDLHLKCIRYIKCNIKEFNYYKNIHVMKYDVFSFLRKKTIISYDLIFADPPYKITSDNIIFFIKMILKNKWIKKKGIIILEHSKKNFIKLNIVFKKSFLYRTIKYGYTFFSILELIN